MSKTGLKILVIGSGGREYAICRKLLTSPLVSEVFCAPGNPGMQAIGIQAVAIDELDFSKLIEFAVTKQISWTFVGPEDALVAGIVDRFQAAGLKIFGPTAQAAQLEGSKKFALEFMQRYQVPTAAYQAYSQPAAALAGLAAFKLPVVVKADGLAAGKGVTVALTRTAAVAAIKQLFAQGQHEVVLEEYLSGAEYSLFAVVGKDNYQLLPMAQDHKRAYDGDQGPNTGGMGAYSPLPQLSERLYQRIVAEVVEPSIKGLRQEKFAYRGILYIGLIATATGPKVIEYNVRLGDPETQVVLPRIKSDFAQLITDCLAERQLAPVSVSNQACLAVVIAAKGYPQAPQTGQLLPELAEQADVKIDFANVTGNSPTTLRAAGGRLAAVVAQADTLISAQTAVYHYLAQKQLSNCFYRHDIGTKATHQIFN
ncbi:MAG: phosphoribosylamine--glycine ligase [Liquorilactobacillus ghanensis]|uniref:phosphoribosylamine--glycine ligase n=1 Tax=Liquorilactobacillus ghanensis TaxID=399370 RepID=UPI0039E83ACA